MSKISRDFIEALSAIGKNKTAPYDIKATVRRIEGRTVYAHFSGGIDETPVEKTIDCKPGDIVQVRVSGGRAWITGNLSAPPTDDAIANKAFNIAGQNTRDIGALNDKTDGLEDDVKSLDGKTVLYTETEYCLSSTRDVFTPYGDWSPELPEYVAGYFYYTRTITHYSNGSTSFSEPVFYLAGQTAAEANKAAENAQNAADTANAIAESALANASDERKVFSSTPTPPYAQGDLWFDGVHGNTYICTTSKDYIYTQFTGSAFVPGTTYYERANGAYYVTGDTTRKSGKTYYTRSTGSYSASDWTLYSTDVSNHFWYDSSGAHVSDVSGSVASGNSQTIAATGTIMLRNGKLVTSWTGSSSADAALNFYDCDTTTLGDSAHLVASYAKSGITQYINNISAMALTASGLTFFSPDSNHYTEAIFGSSGIELYASGKKALELTGGSLKFYNSAGTATLAEFGTTARIGASGSSRFLINAASLQAYNSSNTKYFEVSASGMTFGSSTVATTTNVSDAQNAAQTYADTKANAAAKTATTYITDVDSNKGITIKPSNSAGNDYLLINSNAIAFYRNSTTNSVMNLTDDTFRIGLAASGHSTVKSDGLHVWTGTESTASHEIAVFGSTARIGKSGANHVIIGDSSTDFYSDASTLLGSIKAYSSTFGMISSKAISIVGTGVLIGGGTGNIDIETTGTGTDINLIAKDTISLNGETRILKSLAITGSLTVNTDTTLSGKLTYPNAPTTDSSANARIGTGSPVGRLYRSTASSRRFKHDIETLQDEGLDPHNLYQLPIRQFKFNADYLSPDSPRFGFTVPGFIAEEVYEVYPIAVDLDDQSRPENWNSRYIIPPMLALLQEQHRKIEDLISELETIKEELWTLKAA